MCTKTSTMGSRGALVLGVTMQTPTCVCEWCFEFSCKHRLVCVSGVLSFPLDTEFFLVENLKCRNDKTQKQLEFWHVLGPKLKKNLKKT